MKKRIALLITAICTLIGLLPVMGIFANAEVRELIALRDFCTGANPATYMLPDSFFMDLFPGETPTASGMVVGDALTGGVNYRFATGNKNADVMPLVTQGKDVHITTVLTLEDVTSKTAKTRTIYDLAGQENSPVNFAMFDGGKFYAPGASVSGMLKTERFTYIAGHKYSVEATIHTRTNRVDIKVIDLDDSIDPVKCDVKNIYSNSSNLSYVFRNRYNFSNCTVESIKFETSIVTGLTLSAYSQDLPPYTAGDSFIIKTELTGETPQSVKLYMDSTLIGEKNAAPFEWETDNLAAGTYNFYAEATYSGNSKADASLALPVKEYDKSHTYAFNNFENPQTSEENKYADDNTAWPASINTKEVAAPWNSSNRVGYLNSGASDVSVVISRNGAASETNVFNPAKYLLITGDFRFNSNTWATNANANEGKRSLSLRTYTGSGGTGTTDVNLIEFNKEGTISFAGTALTAPYQADIFYHIEVIIDTISGKCHYLVSDEAGLVYSGYNIALPTANNVNYRRVMRLKLQQNAKPTGILPNDTEPVANQFNFDNIGFYEMSEAGINAGIVSVKKGGSAVHGLSNIQSGDVYTLTANISNNTNTAITNASVIFAVYDGNGVLVDVAVKLNNNISANATSEDVSESFTASGSFADNYSIKAFLWNNGSEIIPITLPRKF